LKSNTTPEKTGVIGPETYGTLESARRMAQARCLEGESSLRRNMPNMPSYKNPDFQERAALAASAKQKALDRLREKPPIDEAVVAKRLAAAAAREAALAEKRAEKLAAKQQAEAEKAEREAQAAREAEEALAAKAAARPELTEAERKALRDQKYAARKSRKGR
jgi:hypothetical protein